MTAWFSVCSERGRAMMIEKKANVDQPGVKQKAIIIIVCVFALKLMAFSFH
jgi:hypothetical protein